MDLDYYADLSGDAALHRWPSDGTKLRAGPNEDQLDMNGHAGYAASLLERVHSKAGEISAALQAQGTFEQTSFFAENAPLVQILTAFAHVEVYMERQWSRHLAGKKVEIIGGNERRLIDQATVGLFAHMKSYMNAVEEDRIGTTEVADLPDDLGGITPDAALVAAFLSV